MKHERVFTGLTAAVLACLLSLGALGSLITGFGLPLENEMAVYPACAAAAALFSLLFSLKKGPVVAACLTAMAGGWLWHRGIFLPQLLSLLVRISKVYHSAYGWGYFLFQVDVLPGDLPLAVLGSLIAMAVSCALVRSKNVVLPLILSALPVAACMVVTDTVPDPAFLFLWFLGLLLTVIPQSVRRENALQGCRLTAMITLPVLLALYLLFLAAPKEGYVNRSQELQAQLLTLAEEAADRLRQSTPALTAGSPGDPEQTLNLKQLGPRPQYTTPVIDITATTDGTFYLRGQDYDVYTGTGWTASPHRAEAFGTAEALTQSVSLSLRSKAEICFLPYYPSRDLLLTGGALRNAEEETSYSFAYAQLPENWREQLELEESQQEHQIELTQQDVLLLGSTADRLRYTTLPGETRVAAQAILEQILPENGCRWEIADAIGDFVKNSAKYDLNTQRMPQDSEDFALWFLEEGETGYCVHFATAAVVLLRAADIPARYVNGYLTRTESGKTVTVTAGDAHAWAEYYVPMLEAWVVLEATPAEEEAQASPLPGTLPGETAAVPTESTPPEIREPTDGTAAPVPTEEGASIPEESHGLHRLLLLPILTGLPVQRAFRLRRRKKAFLSGSPNARALARWAEAERLASLLGQTPPEPLHLLAQKAKFSRHEITGGELAQLDRYLADCRRMLKKKPWYWQLVYRWVFVVY